MASVVLLKRNLGLHVHWCAQPLHCPHPNRAGSEKGRRGNFVSCGSMLSLKRSVKNHGIFLGRSIKSGVYVFVNEDVRPPGVR